jgi:uncharacterized protein YlxW (UPF0749 family)
MFMSKQSITVALFAAIFLMAVFFTNAQTAQKKSGQKRAEQKKIEDLEDEAQIQKSVLWREIERAQEKNDDEKRGQLKFFARPPRSKRSISDKQLVPCDDY